MHSSRSLEGQARLLNVPRVGTRYASCPCRLGIAESGVYDEPDFYCSAVHAGHRRVQGLLQPHEDRVRNGLAPGMVSGDQHTICLCQVGPSPGSSGQVTFTLHPKALLNSIVLAGIPLQCSRNRGSLQVRSAAAETVKVYEKEHNLGKNHKLKVRSHKTPPACFMFSQYKLKHAAGFE